MDWSASARAGALAAFFALAALNPPDAEAQACLGIPQGSAGGIAFSLGFPDAALRYGLEGASANQDTGLLLSGEFALQEPDKETSADTTSTKSVGGWLGWEIEPLNEQVSLCPRGGLTYEWDDVGNELTIPFGVAVGRTLDLTWDGSASVTPFAMPQFLWTRETSDGSGEVMREIVFAVTGGLTLNFGVLVIGGRVGKIFKEGNDPVFSAFVGAAWR